MMTDPADARLAQTKIPGALGGRRTRVVAAIIVLLGVALHVSSLRWGFLWDDFAQQLVLRHQLSGETLHPWSLYDFGLRPAPGDPLYDAAMFPWWTSPDFKARFFRPVSSASIWLDYIMYGAWAPGYHLTSLVLFAAFLWLAFALYGELGASNGARLAALALLAFDEANFLPVAWIANRNTILAALFIVASMYSFRVYRRAGRRSALAASLVCFLLACGSKETGLLVLPLAVLDLWLLDPVAGKSRLAVRRVLRASAFWLFALAAATYLAFYIGAGYGARSVVYPTPWIHPLDFLTRLGKVLPLEALSLLSGLFVDMLALKPILIWPTAIAGVVVVSVAGWVMAGVVKNRRLALFLAIWGVCALLLEAGGDVSARLLVNASVGASLLIAMFLTDLFGAGARLTTRSYRRIAVAVLLLFGGVSGPLTVAVLYRQIGRLADRIHIAVRQADIDTTAPAPRDVLLLNSPTNLLALSMPAEWRVVQYDPGTRVLPLQFGRRALRMTRVDKRTLSFESLSGPFLNGLLESVFVSSRTPPPVGATFSTVAFTATITGVDADGVRVVTLRFERDLESPSCQLVAWSGDRFVRIHPPAIGQTLELPPVKRLLPGAP